MKRCPTSPVNREMQIKTRYHLTSIMMAIILKNEKQQVLTRMRKNWNTCALLVEMHNATAAVENSWAVPQKVKDRIIIWPINSVLRYIPQNIKSRDWSKYLHPNVHSSIMHNSQKEETTINRCPSTDEQINKIWCLYTME